MQEFYNTNYYDNCSEQGGLEDKINTYAALADRLAAQGSRILEIGAGTGFFMSLLTDRGADVFGIELSEASLKLNPFTALGKMARSLEALPQGITFDTVVYLDVIEHILDPEAHLKELAGYLEKGSRLVMVTPDRASLSARLMGSRWAHLSAPEHIHLFTPRGLRALTGRAGFQWAASGPFKKNISIAYAKSILDRYSKLHVDRWLLGVLAAILPERVLAHPWNVCTGQMLAEMVYTHPTDTRSK